MTVTADQIKKGAISYFETEICQKASGVDKFAAYFVLPSIPGIVQTKLDQFGGSPFANGLINPDGQVDLDAVRERALAAMQHCGSLDIMGFRLGPDDVESIYNSIRRA